MGRLLNVLLLLLLPTTRICCLLSVCVAKGDFQGGQEEDQGLRGQERAGQGISGQRVL